MAPTHHEMASLSGYFAMKIGILTLDIKSAWVFRKGLIKTLVAEGNEVYVIATDDGKYSREYIEKLGSIFRPLDIPRFMNVAGDLKFCLSLYHVLRLERFDVVHTFSVKPNTYGAIIARLAGVKHVISTITGLGFALSDESSFLLRNFVSILFKIAGKCCDKISFQNPDDFSLFISSRIVCKKKAFLIRSSGVNLAEYSTDRLDNGKTARIREELAIDDSTKTVLMVARAIWSKGIKEFIEASKALSEVDYRVKFLLVGEPVEDNPLSVPVEYLQAQKTDDFEWIGYRHDLREILALSSVVVLPSYYREGIPKSLLEAMAMSKPIITTNNVGCREAVESGKNGYLIPVKDSKALADAIANLLEDDIKREAFGRYSYIKVKAEFDEEQIIRDTLTYLYGSW